MSNRTWRRVIRERGRGVECVSPADVVGRVDDTVCVVIPINASADVLNRAIEHVAGRQSVRKCEILGVHAKAKPLEPDVDLDALARKTYGFSGAMLADLLNEAAILAARRHAEAISAADLQAGWLKVAVGTGRRRSMDERERAIIAAARDNLGR